MTQMPFVADRDTLDLATSLISDFGDDAGQHAASRADASRSIGNVWQFCRWRQIERLILVLSVKRAPSTVH
jgi:hypothetical protein